MAKTTTAKRIQKSYKQNAKKLRKNHLSPLLAGIAGAVLTIPLMLALMLPILHQEFADQAAAINHKLVSMAPVANYTTGQPASDNSLACTAPSSGPFLGKTTKPAIQTASASMPSNQTSKPSKPEPGKGGSSNPSNTSNVITRLVSSYRTNNKAAISETGAGSVNKVTQTTTNTTTVTNFNKVEATNNNPQTAVSGNVDSSANTTSGDTTSGDATNNADVSFIFTVNN